ncbi:dephospho-CoA kinase [Trichloromonas acetexigens]|uniref:Dephospho-CoA kinase n=1 Tax=Trichloromonas acetexigens TaxID=38815 RepID=A0A550J5S2_9BACT|nr:dephospho-CoA kinase [Desulfuromonas acetexigens]TRO78571.1 dephospho-CoA kinase [Desulfuromonas acetexigens]
MILGITGGIATGKSSVAKIFRELGATVLSADELAREVVAPGSPLLARLAERFGATVLREDGGLDRPALAAIIFADPQARRDLDGLMHPAIATLAETRLRELAARSPLVVYEAPLLFEAGAEGRVDAVLVVTADDETQLRRLMARDGVDEGAARARIAAQMPLAEKVRRSDYVIDNSQGPEAAEQAVRELFTRLREAR